MKSHHPGCRLGDECSCDERDPFDAASAEVKTLPVAKSPADAPTTYQVDCGAEAAGGEIRFFLPIVPPKATSQGAGKRMAIIKGRPMFFKNKAAASAERDMLTLCAPHRPDVPLEGPVALHVDFVWPWRKSEARWRLAHGRLPHTTKPDGSNVIKLLEDCMTKLQFWGDDSQISDLRITKAWGDDVGITVSITPMELPDKNSVPAGQYVPQPLADFAELELNFSNQV